MSPGPTLGEGDDVSGNSFHDQTPAGKRNFPSRDKPAQWATAHDIERGEALLLVGGIWGVSYRVEDHLLGCVRDRPTGNYFGAVP